MPCDSGQALDTSGPPLHSQSCPFPGRLMPQVETEVRGQKPSLRRARMPTISSASVPALMTWDALHPNLCLSPQGPCP